MTQYYKFLDETKNDIVDSFLNDLIHVNTFENLIKLKVEQLQPKTKKPPRTIPAKWSTLYRHRDSHLLHSPVPMTQYLLRSILSVLFITLYLLRRI